jgi:hypothetical protein
MINEIERKMSQKEKLPLKAIVLLAIFLLFVASILIAFRLLTAEYPTHSDVFYMGVEFGALVILFLVCLILIGLRLYHLITTLYKLKT